MAGTPQRKDFASQIRDLEKRLYVLEHTSRLNSASIGSGGLVVRDGGSVTIESPGDLLLEDPDGTVVWRASVDPTVTAGCYDRNNGLSLATSWTDYGFTIPDLQARMPAGFNYGNFAITVSAGDSFSGSGNVSVQPEVIFIMPDGSTAGPFFGDAINSGNSNVSVATSFWSANFTVPPLTRVKFGLSAIRTGTEFSGTSGNWHCMAQVMFRRGPFPT